MQSKPYIRHRSPSWQTRATCLYMQQIKTANAQQHLHIPAQSKPYIRHAFTILADEGNLPAVVHCTHGKDRTGLLVALLLLMLGVDEAAVVQDYVLSEEELKVGFEPDQSLEACDQYSEGL